MHEMISYLLFLIVFRLICDTDCFLQIKKLYPDANLRLPGKRLFGNLDPDFIQQRRDGLDEFIQKLVSHPKISQQ